ncbi:MAG TPA: BON domain-containing protein [Pirellulales bacterium]
MVTAISSRRSSTAGQWPATAAEAQRRLQNSPYPSHRRLHCSFRAGVLIVHGRVSSYYLRQMAFALVADLDGVDQFVDRVEVVAPA